MKYLDEYRDPDAAERISVDLHRITTRPWTIMEVCGGQTHSILQYGIEDLLPEQIRLVHGPGCPVCVTPISVIDRSIAIALESDVIFCSFGDMLRVPGSSLDLLDARASGADVRFVYSPLDSLEIARTNPDKKVVFLAVGFETTAPANAMALIQARELSVSNYFVLCSHVTVPPVCTAILQAPGNLVQAFIGPGHVCTVMGYREYEPIAENYKVPIVITGFEPLDLLIGIHAAVEELERGSYRVINRYQRVVSSKGNERARALVAEVFDVVDREWRGLGWIPKSGYRLSPDFSAFDADLHFDRSDVCPRQEADNCISGQILRGMKKPTDCPEFGQGCTPETPLGATMVSSEGTCANYFKFRRLPIKELM
ncbi:MAG: hydrogenase formation protein HypD [Cyanobacteria bacterium]|nr:hydrogenase formation protein HypD [Cyanobacteriota bacterium]